MCCEASSSCVCDDDHTTHTGQLFFDGDLVPHAAARVYGIVTGLTHADIDTLYADASVRDYRPEAVLVTREDGRQVPALCYTLPTVTGSHRNTTYAVKLLELAKALAFPGGYLDTLHKLTQ